MTFEFSIGGYFGTSYHLELIGSTLKCCESVGYPEISREEIIGVEGNPEWHEVLNFLSTRKWKKEYMDDSLDGTQWQLQISGDKMNIDSHGSNAYPPGFRKFLRLLNKVVSEANMSVY